MNEYMSFVGLFIFVAIVGGVGLWSKFTLQARYREEDEARRKSLDKH